MAKNCAGKIASELWRILSRDQKDNFSIHGVFEFGVLKFSRMD